VLGEDEIDVTRLTPDDVVQFMGSILGVIASKFLPEIGPESPQEEM